MDKASEISDEPITIRARVQYSGILLKRPFNHQSSRWAKRFFVVKEGFLLYYPEAEKRLFDKRGTFNVHPRGALPLGGCIVDAAEESSQPYVIHIKSDQFSNGYFALAAETSAEQHRWISTLEEASRVNLKNTQLGEAMIRDLEDHGLALTKEKQNYFEKLQQETLALQDERERNEKLEIVKVELERERTKLQELIQRLEDEHTRLKMEYTDTLKAMDSVREDKKELHSTIDLLQNTLEQLSDEKKTIQLLLEHSEEENSKLSENTLNLQECLKAIDEETRLLLNEKKDMENRYIQNERRAQVLEEEKKVIAHQSTQLMCSLNELVVEQSLTEAELREEITARVDAETRLEKAQKCMKCLEKSFSESDMKPELKQRLLPHVCTLRDFFEQVAKEARMDADKPLIMKNAVLARKNLAQHWREQKLKQQRETTLKRLGLPEPFEAPAPPKGAQSEEGPSSVTVKRSLSMLITSNTLRRKPKVNLKRTNTLARPTTKKTIPATP